MLISVVIPTHNRHVLLREAIASVESQSYAKWEVIVVDDASDRPVVLDELELIDANRFLLRRNGEALGPSGARNAGIEAASGDLVTFLDDDDLLTHDALESIAGAFRERDDLECLFINVDPFGKWSEGTLANQENALRRVLGGLSLDPRTTKGVLPLPGNLFDVLLDGLPMAFQRMTIRRAALSKVGNYTGQGFEDIEFYFRVALRCRCAFLADAVYRLRCDGQSFFSRADAKARLIDASIRIRKGLLGLPEVSVSRDRQRRVRRTLADARFDRAYYAYKAGKEFPWRDYWASCATGVTWAHASILIKALASSVSRNKPAARHL